jgi:hypothetical protein
MRVDRADVRRVSGQIPMALELTVARATQVPTALLAV